MDDPVGSKKVCPITGFSIMSNPEWAYEGKKGGFKIEVSLIGKRILYAKPRGHVFNDDQVQSISLQASIAETAIGENEPFIQIQDWKELKGASNRARQNYIDYLTDNDQVMGVIFCNTSFMFKMSIKLGKRLNMVPYPVHIADDYDQAIKTAQILLEKWKVSNKKEDSLLPFIFSPLDSDKTDCKITGLEIVKKLEWTDIEIVKDYFCTFKLIGKSIVHVSLSGEITPEGTHRLIQIHDKFMSDMGLSNKKYAEVRECSNVIGGPFQKSRFKLMEFVSRESQTNGLVGLWYYNFPQLIINTFRAGYKLKDTDAPIKIVNTYKDAIKQSVSALRENSVEIETLDFSKQRFSKSDWLLKREGSSIKFEIIGDDIIYSEPHGILKEEYVDELFVIYQKVIKEGGFDKDRPYYRLLNWENFEGTHWRARKKYISQAKDINKLHPSPLSVVYGMNSFMSLMMNMTKPFLPFETLTAINFQHALELIEKDRAFIKNKTEKSPDQGFDVKIDKYKYQLLKVMGSLDWDQKGIQEQKIDDAHPFKEVFDAVSIIKADLDSVFEERNEAEIKLKQSEEKYRNIIENIDDGYYEADLKGNLLFINERFSRIFGYSKSEFDMVNYSQIMDKKTAKSFLQAYNKVYKTKQPITDFGYKMLTKDGKKLYGEASISLKYGMDGTITGFCGITRDRTEKKALEDELIKHRDDLEKMIAQRTKELQEEIIQKEYAKKVNSSIFNISAAVTTSQSLDELCPLIHKYLDDIVDIPNFYIGIYEPKKDKILIIFNSDKYHGNIFQMNDISKTKSLASEVVLKSKPLLVRDQEIIDWSKEKDFVGHISKNWLGVPLISQDRTMGIMAGQSYEDPDHFTDHDLNILVSVSNQVALAIERQQALDDLHEREEKYGKLIKTTSAGYWQIDENYLTIEVNQAMCNMIGYEEDEMIGRPPFDFFDKQSIKNVKEITTKENAQTANISYEVTFIKKDNQLLHSKVDARRSFNENGDFAGSFVFVTDITDRIKSQQELRRAKENAEEASKTTKIIMENLQAGVVLINWDTHIIELVNKTASDMFGSPPENIVGNYCYEFLCPKQKGQCPITDVNATVDNSEKYMLNVHKEKIPILKTINTVVMNGQKFLLESFVDITEQKNAENNLINETRRANEMAMAAEAANTAKSEFLANMSHEIRTPINGVVGMAEILMDSSLDENQKTFVQTISSEADSLLGIINTILDFSKIEAGKLELEEIGFDLRKIFENLSEVLNIRAEKKGLDFLSFLDTDIPTDLKGDPGRLRQIFMNLVGNSLKFTNKGEIFIKGTKITETADRVTIRFEVQDTGIGIPFEKQDRIFDSFSQADGSTTRKYGGTGLGTTISKQLVELMGGEIGLESKKGKGSKFWFTINVKKWGSKSQQEKGVDINLEGLIILVVDSNKTHQFIISKYLETFGCKALSALNIEDAMRILEKQDSNQKIDLILTDFYFSEINGFEFAEHIRKSKLYIEIPIVLLTSVGSVGDGKRCREIGIQGYLSKPVKKIDLGMTIASVLGVIKELPHNEKPLITKHSIEESERKDLQILVAEDYPTNQQIAIKHLNSAGFRVVLAENGAQAVSLFKTKQFDLILMDIQMPEMDGYEATKKIREIEKKLSKDFGKVLRTPVIAITAHAMRGYRDKCIQADMDDYLAKPLKKKELISTVEKWIYPDQDGNRSTNPKTNTIDKNINSSNLKQSSDLPIDMEKAIIEFENDEEFLNEILYEFLGNVEKQFVSIRAAISVDDFQIIEEQSHAIKGGAANLTAMALSDAASNLEMAGKNQDINNIEEIFGKLEVVYKQFSQYVKQFISA
ncbi:MAG: response regulator [Desulfobacteraceae bacterium]|nr:response regulator [Desulfobacteraceae bacterium]